LLGGSSEYRNASEVSATVRGCSRARGTERAEVADGNPVLPTGLRNRPADPPLSRGAEGAGGRVRREASDQDSEASQGRRLQRSLAGGAFQGRCQESIGHGEARGYQAREEGARGCSRSSHVRSGCSGASAVHSAACSRQAHDPAPGLSDLGSGSFRQDGKRGDPQSQTCEVGSLQVEAPSGLAH